MFSLASGFLLPFRALSLLMHPDVRWFAALPILLNLMVYGVLTWLAIGYFETFMAAYLPEDAWWHFFRPLVWIIFALAYLIALFFSFTLVANFIASPFNAALSARVEKALTGKMPDNADTGFLAAIGPAIAGELGKIGYFLKWALPLLILFLIPGINAVAALLWMLFGLWFLVIEYADYPMGNHALKPKEQRRRLGKRRVKSLGFGAGITVMMLLLGFIAMPAAVAGATRFWLDDFQNITP